MTEHFNVAHSIRSSVELGCPSHNKETTSIPESVTFILEDILNFSRLAVKAISQDEFTRCFEPKDVRDSSIFGSKTKSFFPSYILTVCYFFGIFIRYFVLFPMRLGLLMTSSILFLLLLPFIISKNDPAWTRFFFHALSKCWALCICAYLTHHGEKPNLLGKEPHIFVSNHTSFIDFVLLSSHKIPHATVSQTHGGLFALVQKYFLSLTGSLTFQRNEKKDREWLAFKLRDHVSNIYTAAPILIFPEGTCVNNDYTVLFHKGAFELGIAVCPVAIKFIETSLPHRYNKKLVDPYWNTREQSFTYHALYLMTRWLVVADIWWFPPQYIKEGESSIHFAERVKEMISSAAKLKNLSWDGYLKNYMAGKDQSKLLQKTQRTYRNSLFYRLGNSPHSPDFSPMISYGDSQQSTLDESLVPSWLSFDTYLSYYVDVLETIYGKIKSFPCALSSKFGQKAD